MKPVLKNWYITISCKEGQTMCRAHGVVFGHISPRCIDGQHIHTSSIKEITLSDADTLQIHTRNTIYYVKLNEYGKLTDINNAADHNSFPTSNDDCTADALKIFNIPTEIYPKMAELRKVRFEQRKSVIDSCGGRLAPGEMYLALSAVADHYFDFGVVKVSEEIFMLHKSVHVGNFQDSVLISHEQEVLVRYFPYGANNLAFYESLYQEPIDMPEGTRLGYLKNTGNMPLNIRFTWGKCITLVAGEELEVRYLETGSDDLQLTDETDKYPAMPF